MARNNGKNFKRTFVSDILISDAHISGRPNFSGLERTINGRTVNGAGNRNFCVDIPEDGVMLNDGTNTWVTLAELIEMGWPIKIHNAYGQSEPDDIPSYYLPIQVKFNVRPPEVNLVIGDELHTITENEIDTFDGRTFSKVNLVVHPSVRQDWDTGETKITAYLAEGWFYIQLSPFAKQWYDEHPVGDME